MNKTDDDQIYGFITQKQTRLKHTHEHVTYDNFKTKNLKLYDYMTYVYKLMTI